MDIKVWRLEKVTCSIEPYSNSVSSHMGWYWAVRLVPGAFLLGNTNYAEIFLAWRFRYPNSHIQFVYGSHYKNDYVSHYGLMGSQVNIVKLNCSVLCFAEDYWS